MTDAPGEDAIDGIKVDEVGNLYVCGPGGIWVLAPQGEHLGRSGCPRSRTTSPGATPTVGRFTSRRLTSVYRLRLNIAGIRPNLRRTMSKGLTSGRCCPTSCSPTTGAPAPAVQLQGDNAMVLSSGAASTARVNASTSGRCSRSSSARRSRSPTLVTVLPNDQHDTNKMKIAAGALVDVSVRRGSHGPA